MNADIVGSVLALLCWQGELGEQGLAVPTSAVVLIPSGTELRARAVADGKPVWRYSFVEARGALAAPRRIQSLVVYPGPAPGLPGLTRPRAGTVSRDDRDAIACLAGQSELHALDVRTGRTRWTAAKRDGCVISLHRVGDVDSDGVDDLVCCGCNLAECFSGRTGVVLWKDPVSGRSLWAGPAGDLDGDGLGEVLLQGGRQLRVLTPTGGGRVLPRYDVDGFLPIGSVALRRRALVVFDGAEVKRCGPRGVDGTVWARRGRVLAFSRLGDRGAVATEDGLWIEGPDGKLGAAWRGRLRAAAFARDAVFLATTDRALLRMPVGARSPATVTRFREDVATIAVDRSGRVVCALSGASVRVLSIRPEEATGGDRAGAAAGAVASEPRGEP